MCTKYVRSVLKSFGVFALTLSLISFSFGTLAPQALAADADGDCYDDTTGEFINGCTTSSSGTLDADDLFGDLSSGDDFADIAGLGSQDLATTIASIIRVALGFLGVLAVCLIILGGFKWMLSSGDDAKTKKAQNLIIYGVVGLVIVLAAYAIAFFVIESITTAVS